MEMEEEKITKVKDGLTYQDFYKVANVKQHSEFERFLNKIIFEPEERNQFYRDLLSINNDVSTDTFKSYFELYAAERKSFAQDYTPDSVAKLLAVITRQDAIKVGAGYSGYDPTAGTGTLLINKWYDDMTQESIFSYAPHRYLYFAEEMADNAIPYLIHNLALRGMNAIIIHGDTLHRNAKQIYFIQNSKDDFLGFSDVNVLEHTDEVTELFNIHSWEEDAIEYQETTEIEMSYAIPMKRKALEINPSPKTQARPQMKDMILLKDIAVLERAKKGQIYPESTVIVQISATKGQVGLLTSNGEVGSQYVCINFNPVYCTGEYGFYWLKNKLPRHIHRVQQGLNITLEDLEKTPIHIPPLEEQEEIVELIKDETGQLAFDI